MLAGEAFKTGDAELMEDKKNARVLAEKYNRSSEDDLELRKKLLKTLFGKCGEKIMIKPPFHCDYGYRIFIGENFLPISTVCFWTPLRSKSAIIA